MNILRCEGLKNLYDPVYESVENKWIRVEFVL